MSAYKFHGDAQELVPWNATYSFPTASTKVYKQTVKIQPKNGASFGSSQSGYKLRTEFPADSYLNPLNSVLNFNLRITSKKDDASHYAGFISKSNTGSEDSTSNSNATTEGLSILTSTKAAAPWTTYNTFKIFNQQRNPNWTLFHNDNSKITGFFAGWVFRYTSGKRSGHHTVIVDSSYSDANNQNVFTFALDPDFPTADYGDTYEIIPGWKFQQGGVHNLFSRVRVLYGSLVIEDLQYYSSMSRILYEMGVQSPYVGTIGSILDGTSSDHLQFSAATPFDADSYIGEKTVGKPTSWESMAFDQLHDSYSLLWGPVANHKLGGFSTDRYVSAYQQSSLSDRNPGKIFNCSIFSGFMSQPKLIPLKWMAAQLAIEFEFNQPAVAFIGGGSSDLQYELSNVNYISELIEFDSTYDVAFAQELTKGIPLKFASYDAFVNTVSGTQLNNQIQERARSVKYMLSVIKDTTVNSLYTDSDRFFQCLGEYYEFVGSTPFQTKVPALRQVGWCPISDFQYRIGGRYYPAQPVIAGVTGGGEAYAELMKVVDYLGDYAKGTLIDMYSWNAKYLGGGSKFIMANVAENIDLFGGAISGINAEEQSDIMLIVKANEQSRPRDVASTKYLYTFVAFDALAIVSAGNNVELVK